MIFFMNWHAINDYGVVICLLCDIVATSDTGEFMVVDVTLIGPPQICTHLSGNFEDLLLYTIFTSKFLLIKDITAIALILL